MFSPITEHMSNDELTTTDEQSDQLKNSMISSLGESGNISKSCKATGIGRTTYYDWCTASPSFREQATKALNLAREQRIDKLEDAIMDQALGNEAKGIKPNPISQIFALKALTRQSDRVWSDAPPAIELKTEDNDKAPPLNETSSALQDLMSKFVKDVAKAEQSATAIEGETVIPAKPTNHNTQPLKQPTLNASEAPTQGPS